MISNDKRGPLNEDGKVTRGGYTLVELLVTMLIAAIVMSVAVPQFTTMMQRRNAQNARDDFVWMAVRARARAIERGSAYLLEVNPSTSRAWIVKRNPSSASDTVQTVAFNTEFNASVTTSTGNKITVCYSPRGFAFTCDATYSPTANVTVTFTHIDKTSSATVRPLGQVIRN